MAHYVILFPSEEGDTDYNIASERAHRFNEWLYSVCSGVHGVNWTCIEYDDGSLFCGIFETPSIIPQSAFEYICKAYRVPEATLKILQ